MRDLRRMLPSSNALFVFDAAARNGSFTAAAAELNVTQPAVSRMLGRFEDYLGVRLFNRTAGGAALTEEGELLYRRGGWVWLIPGSQRGRGLQPPTGPAQPDTPPPPALHAAPRDAGPRLDAPT